MILLSSVLLNLVCFVNILLPLCGKRMQNGTVWLLICELFGVVSEVGKFNLSCVSLLYDKS